MSATKEDRINVRILAQWTRHEDYHDMLRWWATRQVSLNLGFPDERNALGWALWLLSVKAKQSEYLTPQFVENPALCQGKRMGPQGNWQYIRQNLTA